MKELILIVVLFLFPFTCLAERVGFITDIHAGRASIRKTRGNTIYPRRALSLFKLAMKQMDVHEIIALGDNINSKRDKKYQRKLQIIADKYGKKIIWVTGNHDLVNHGNYWYEDREGYRLIILNTADKNPKSEGGLLPTQKEWFQQALNTDKRIVICAHHPIIMPELANKDVRYFAGHWHTDAYMENGNAKYTVFRAFTRNKIPNYYIIDL